MHLEEFAEGSSLFHRLDPRVKFLSLMPYIIVVAVMKDLYYPVIALLISALMIAVARIDLKKLFNRLAAVNIFILLLWVFLPFTYPGETLFHAGPLSVSREGIFFSLSITLKANAIVLATISVLGTSEVFSLAHALVHLKVPGKLVHLFFFFYRYISVLHEEYTALKRAISMRAFRPRTTMHTYKTYAYLVGMLLVRSYDRSERVYNAMLCRGFTGRFPIITHFHMHTRDYVFGSVMTLTTLVMGVFAFSGF
ncbi:MAG: cobalt ECF transporter T component CbiQ [Nitrospirota bacterium]